MNQLVFQIIHFLGMSVLLTLSSMEVSAQTEVLDALKAEPISLTDCSEDIGNALYSICKNYFEIEKLDSASVYLAKLKLYNSNCPKPSNLASYQYCKGLEFYSSSNTDSALGYMELALSTAVKDGDFQKQVEVHRNLGRFYGQKTKLEKAESNSLECLALARKNNDLWSLAQGYLSLGGVQMSRRELNKAVSSFLKTDSLYTLAKRKDVHLFLAYLNAGDIFVATKDFDIGKKYYERARQTSLKINYSSGQMKSIAKIARVKTLQGDYVNARKDLRPLLQYYDDLNDKKSLAGICRKLGELYSKTQNYKKSERQFLRNNELSLELGDSTNLVSGLMNLSNLYNEMGQYKKAIEVINYAIRVKPQQFDSYQQFYWLLANSQSKLKNYKGAYANLNRYIDLNDSIEDRRDIQTLQELETKYETEKKQTQIQTLEKENTLIKQRRWLLVGITALLFLIPLLYLNQRIKKRKKIYQAEIAQLQLASLKSQMSPHFMFNSINSIKGMIINDAAEAAADQLTKFSKFMRNILNYSGGEFISLTEEIEFLKQYVNLENFKREQAVAVSFEGVESLAKDDIEVLPFLIQPFLENSFKHAFTRETINPKIELSFKRSGEWLEVTILDNGIGSKRDTGLGHVSKGTALVKNRLALHNGSSDNVKIDFKGEGKGTEVSLKLKI